MLQHVGSMVQPIISNKGISGYTIAEYTSTFGVKSDVFRAIQGVNLLALQAVLSTGSTGDMSLGEVVFMPQAPRAQIAKLLYYLQDTEWHLLTTIGAS